MEKALWVLFFPLNAAKNPGWNDFLSRKVKVTGERGKKTRIRNATEPCMRFLDLFPPVLPGLDSKAAPNMGCAPSPSADTKSTKRSSLLLVLRVERVPYKAERVGEKPFFVCLFVCFPMQVPGISAEGEWQRQMWLSPLSSHYNLAEGTESMRHR